MKVGSALVAVMKKKEQKNEIMVKDKLVKKNEKEKKKKRVNQKLRFNSLSYCDPFKGLTSSNKYFFHIHELKIEYMITYLKNKVIINHNTFY